MSGKAFQFAALLMVLCAIEAKSQKLGFGIRLGLNIANQQVSNNPSPEITRTSRNGLLAGVYAHKMLSTRMGIQSEVLYSQCGSYFSGFFATNQPIQGNYNLTYLTVPLLLRINAIQNIHFLIGPQYARLLTAELSAGTIHQDIKSGYHSNEFSIVAGAGWDVGPFNLGARYVLGTTGLETSGDVVTKNRILQLIIGYRLFGDQQD